MIHTTCLCGQNHLSLEGDPAVGAYCHCTSCRDLYGASFLSATAWNPEQIDFHPQLTHTFSHPHKQLAKTYCRHCGETLFGSNRLGMKIVPNVILARAFYAGLPDNLKPSMHLFYAQRVVDIDDDLIKYVDGWEGDTWDKTS